eukprot:m.208057 g.208057  ORF g.208057 m.208057 type:complete len:465 (-) comp15806_c0_seq26:1221-2615(-)
MDHCSREETAMLVAEYLKEEKYLSTLGQFQVEARKVLEGVAPPRARSKSLHTILSEYIALKRAASRRAAFLNEGSTTTTKVLLDNIFDLLEDIKKQQLPNVTTQRVSSQQVETPVNPVRHANGKQRYTGPPIQEPGVRVPVSHSFSGLRPPITSGNIAQGGQRFPEAPKTPSKTRKSVQPRKLGPSSNDDRQNHYHEPERNERPTTAERPIDLDSDLNLFDSVDPTIQRISDAIASNVNKYYTGSGNVFASVDQIVNETANIPEIAQLIGDLSLPGFGNSIGDNTEDQPRLDTSGNTETNREPPMHVTGNDNSTVSLSSQINNSTNGNEHQGKEDAERQAATALLVLETSLAASASNDMSVSGGQVQHHHSDTSTRPSQEATGGIGHFSHITASKHSQLSSDFGNNSNSSDNTNKRKSPSSSMSPSKRTAIQSVEIPTVAPESVDIDAFLSIVHGDTSSTEATQ